MVFSEAIFRAPAYAGARNIASEYNASCMDLILKAILMGIIEGLTEFLPVSSTGHLIIAGQVLGIPEATAATFEIFIQLGAIVAVGVYFFKDLLSLLQRARNDPGARRLLIGIAIAFVPAALIGFVFRKQIKAILFGPFPVALAMVIGGIIMLVAERWFKTHAATVREIENVSLKQAAAIGIAQIGALFPGMSRSMTTIVGGMVAGLDRPTALRFSFYLSIPTLVIASVYELASSLKDIPGGQIPAFAVGLGVSFAVALVVIRFFLRYVARHDLVPFAWYRIVVGLVLLAVVVPLPVIR